MKGLGLVLLAALLCSAPGESGGSPLWGGQVACKRVGGSSRENRVWGCGPPPMEPTKPTALPKTS